MSLSVDTARRPVDRGDGYEDLMADVAARVAALRGPLFRVIPDTREAAWRAWLAGIPEEGRQTYTCHSCRRFMLRYGSLVTLSDSGEQASALWGNWDSFPPYFRVSTEAVAEHLADAKVSGVAIDGRAVWGEPRTGDWRHLSGRPAPGLVWTNRVKNSGQGEAERLQETLPMGVDFR